jgi:hypothetical protein
VATSFGIPLGLAIAASGYGSPAVPAENGATGAASAISTTIPAVTGKYSYLTGFSVTGLGATSATTISVTITGLTNTLTFVIAIPAGATTAITPLLVFFNTPLQSSATGTAITVNVPSFGTGNTSAQVNAWGFQQ